MNRTSRQPQRPNQGDLDNERMGRNSLQGNDQGSVRNERQAIPGRRNREDGSVIDSFRKMDKDRRAEQELGKGATRSSVRD